MIKFLQLAVLLLAVLNTYAWLNGGYYLNQFERCTGLVTKGSPNSLQGDVHEQQCTDLLIPLDASQKRIGNFSDEQMNYIQSLFRKMFTESKGVSSNRVKRHSGYGPEIVVLQPKIPAFQPEQMSFKPKTWRIREEIRANNGLPFRKYADAVVKLKKTGCYDILADIHVTVVSTAHFGPNFLSWHRLYLLIVETALGVPIPYYDSSEDIVLKKPEQSIVWSKKYFGNGFGAVRTGPFAFFNTPIGPLFRKINAWGSLIDDKSIEKYVFSQARLGQISSPTAKKLSNLEGYHNNVHCWINGIMGNLKFSAYDPVFFTLHSMIDCYWEDFRKGQAKRGINPGTDLVKTNIPGQSPFDKAGIESFKNIDGNSNKIASMVHFERPSECPYCHGSSDKYCDFFSGRCISRTRFDFEDPRGLKEADKLADLSGLSSGAWGGPFTAFQVDRRVRGDPIQK